MKAIWQSIRRPPVSESFNLDRIVLSPLINKSGPSSVTDRSELYNVSEELPRGLIVLAILCGKAD
jgi:hypothetical protein